MTEEMQKLAAELGALVRADERFAALDAAIDAYERSEDLNGLIAEYNVQQNLLADLAAADDSAREAVQKRIDALFDEITNHPAYVGYEDAKAEFDRLMNDVWGELQFAVTGRRACSHNCASCGGCA